jgi:hypothetical protein
MKHATRLLAALSFVLSTSAAFALDPHVEAAGVIRDPERQPTIEPRRHADIDWEK